MPASQCLKIAALTLLLPAVSLADVVVSHFEPIQQLQFVTTDTKTQSFRADAPRAAATRLDFEALGQRFEFELQVNERVAASLPATVGNADIRVYRGELRDKSGSWARIVMFEGRPSGVFSDGTAMYAIESPGDSSLSVDTPVVFRLADALIAPGTMSCGTASLTGPASSVAREITRSSKAALAKGPGALSEIVVSAIADFEFTSARGGESAARAAIAARMNNIDGFFSAQVGVQITAKQPIETHADSNDPFTDTTESEKLLDELSMYRSDTPFHSDAGLTHLWTGRDLDDTTVGIAWRGALCSDYFGTGLTEGNAGPLIDSLIAAHEIGHNFNAEHDGEPDTSCPDETANFIMSASVSGSQTFSDCSIAVMQVDATAASCVTALPTVDVGIANASDLDVLLLDVPTDIDYQVSSNGTLEVPGVTASIQVPNSLLLNSVSASAGSCIDGAGTVDCDIGDLEGLGNATITLSVTPATVGNGALSAIVSTTGDDERAGNNQVSSAYSIVAPVDLIARQPTAPDVVLESNTTVTAIIENTSAVDATGVSATLVLQNGIEAVSASWPVGSCTITAQQVDCQANSLTAMSSSAVTMTVSSNMLGPREVTVTVASAEPDANPQNNVVTGVVRVKDAQSQKDDSGSGSLHPILLLIGLQLAVVTRRRRATKDGAVTA